MLYIKLVECLTSVHESAGVHLHATLTWCGGIYLQSSIGEAKAGRPEVHENIVNYIVRLRLGWATKEGKRSRRKRRRERNRGREKRREEKTK